MIKPCKKGLDIYNAIENWYKYKNEKIDEEELNPTVNLINDFYSRIPYKIQRKDKILTDIEIDEILKNGAIKYHGITIMPQKDDLKKLLKFLKKKEKDNISYKNNGKAKTKIHILLKGTHNGIDRFYNRQN